jgi:hypothetical protein
MNTTPRPIETLQGESYQATRFNALRHGVLSRYTVLPWEDKAEYQTLLGALVAEHSPVGPTEEHLVEELAGIVWRKRRLRVARQSGWKRASIRMSDAQVSLRSGFARPPADLRVGSVPQGDEPATP